MAPVPAPEIEALPSDEGTPLQTTDESALLLGAQYNGIHSPGYLAAEGEGQWTTSSASIEDDEPPESRLAGDRGLRDHSLFSSGGSKPGSLGGSTFSLETGPRQETRQRRYDIPIEQIEEHRQQSRGASFLDWVKSWAIPGIGMFCEAYFIFSIGNISPLLAAARPACVQQYQECPEGLINSEHFVQVAGIMVGMFTMGFVADQIGRKWGSVMCAAFMFAGGVILTASGGPSLLVWAWLFTVGQAIFGYGVGGEYPLASSSAAERAEASKEMRNRRGEMIVCTFSMQGWGNFVNTCVILIFLTVFGQTAVETRKLDKKLLDLTWRLSFVVGLVPVVFMLMYRLFFLKESKVFMKHQKDSSVLWKEQGVLWKHYWHRLVGTCGAWFFWDVSFYGNKLFQSTFINIISGGHASIQVNLMWTALNSFIALVGYYFAAFTIDKKWMGRVRLQNMGFLIVFVCFLVCGVEYDWLISTPQTLHLFQFLYFASSFFGQFGPNATTWMLPGEIFPTDVRATCHGLSATIGKLGALLAGIFFEFMTIKAKFYVSAFFNLFGLVVTILFVPNILGLDLREGDIRWLALYNGDPYHGEAVNPDMLSMYERMTGIGKQYSQHKALEMMRMRELADRDATHKASVTAQASRFA
eukprot:jgi/Botrbrau1/4182/Bobra.0192s0042.1